MQDSKILNNFIHLLDSFHNLHKDLLTPKSRIKKLLHHKDNYLDIYPLILSDVEESTVSLTLQLGWIISRVDIWKKYHKLRILGIVENPANIKSEEKRLKQILHIARIIADISVVCVEDSDLSEAKLQYPEDKASDNKNDLFPVFKNCSIKQKYYILNKILQRNSSKTSNNFSVLLTI